MFQELDAFLRPHRIHADLALTQHRVVWDVAVAQQTETRVLRHEHPHAVTLKQDFALLQQAVQRTGRHL